MIKNAPAKSRGYCRDSAIAVDIAGYLSSSAWACEPKGCHYDQIQNPVPSAGAVRGVWGIQQRKGSRRCEMGTLRRVVQEFAPVFKSDPGSGPEREFSFSRWQNESRIWILGRWKNVARAFCARPGGALGFCYFVLGCVEYRVAKPIGWVRLPRPLK